ncbi:hemerythrin domain-containing protein [Cupriavidus sp. UYPR2.512]|uniref:hemerythrin domain-containing protein n=1 Tax=Cupriavidus sp. UYPR2.512 TaxID=1080187 RepID=UPI000476FB6D|nr:hemerythrin domain-containing protein [Cupriavidus sp. UYPR2.512]UIF88268.1 hemerythrin domain-containing protein [Cupriavidus necator]
MNNAISDWHTDHLYFAHLLDLLQKQVGSFFEGKQPNYRLIAKIVEYMRDYGDRVHHPREDVAFSLLVERYPDMQLVVNRLLQEHQVIAETSAQLLEHFNGAELDVITPRDVLVALAAVYLAYYRNHLSTEEKLVIPRAVKMLNAEDWAKVDVVVPASAQSLRGISLQEHFETLRKQIHDEERLDS